MYLYEIYYINKLKPGLNCDDLADDDLTIELPELEFKEFSAPILESWSSELECINNDITTAHTLLEVHHAEHKVYATLHLCTK